MSFCWTFIGFSRVSNGPRFTDVIKGIVGRILGVGSFVDAGGGHLSFKSSLECADISLSTLAHFLLTGKATLR